MEKKSGANNSEYTLSLRMLDKCLRELDNLLENIRSELAVESYLLFGVSKAGKSTFSARLESDDSAAEFYQKLYDSSKVTDVTRIAGYEISAGAQAVTDVPKKVGIQKNLYDMPGFRDTVAYRRSVVSVIHHMFFSRVTRCKFVIVMSASVLDEGAGQITGTYLPELTSLFGQNFETFIDCCFFVFTHVDKNKDIVEKLHDKIKEIGFSLAKDSRAVVFFNRIFHHHMTVDYENEEKSVILDKLIKMIEGSPGFSNPQNFNLSEKIQNQNELIHTCISKIGSMAETLGAKATVLKDGIQELISEFQITLQCLKSKLDKVNSSDTEFLGLKEENRKTTLALSSDRGELRHQQFILTELQNEMSNLKKLGVTEDIDCKKTKLFIINSTPSGGKHKIRISNCLTTASSENIKYLLTEYVNRENSQHYLMKNDLTEIKSTGLKVYKDGFGGTCDRSFRVESSTENCTINITANTPFSLFIEHEIDLQLDGTINILLRRLNDEIDNLAKRIGSVEGEIASLKVTIVDHETNLSRIQQRASMISREMPGLVYDISENKVKILKNLESKTEKLAAAWNEAVQNTEQSSEYVELKNSSEIFDKYRFPQMKTEFRNVTAGKKKGDDLQVLLQNKAVEYIKNINDIKEPLHLISNNAYIRQLTD